MDGYPKEILHRPPCVLLGKDDESEPSSMDPVLTPYQPSHWKSPRRYKFQSVGGGGQLLVDDGHRVYQEGTLRGSYPWWHCGNMVSLAKAKQGKIKWPGGFAGCGEVSAQIVCKFG